MRVAGHAGLFSTADDMAKFCRMLLGGGTLATRGSRVLSPLTVARMTAPSTPGNEANIRGLGWDLDSSYSSNRGELLPLGSFGHTGFTGTSVWVDPATKTFVVILANRVHPDGKGDASPLRARVALLLQPSDHSHVFRQAITQAWIHLENIDPCAHAAVMRQIAHILAREEVLTGGHGSQAQIDDGSVECVIERVAHFLQPTQLVCGQGACIGLRRGQIKTTIGIHRQA